MIYKLPKEYYNRVRPLITGRPDINTTLNAIADNTNRGNIYVDNISLPRTALFWAIGCRYFITGDAANPAFNDFLDPFIDNVLGPESLGACGGTHFVLSPCDDAWLPVLYNIFRDRKLELWDQFIYEFDAVGPRDSANPLPGGYSIRKIDRQIIENDENRLIEQDVLDAFWDSTGAFLKNGFGFCVLEGTRPVSNCFTGYISGAFNEIAIRTYSKSDRGKGFAFAAAWAYIDYCLKNSMTPHWRTEDDNPASQALAAKCGFRLFKKCRTYCFPFGDII